MTIHLIVSCVKDKIYSGPSLSDVNPEKIDNVYKQWLKLIQKSQSENPQVEAINLYKGNAWKTNVDIFNNINLEDKKLWIISCGYGLITSNTKVTGYQATFQQNEEGSIFNIIKEDSKNKSISNSEISKKWWNSLVTDTSLTNEIASLNNLLTTSPLDDKFIIVLSKNYLDAVSEDLLQGLKKRSKDCLIISNSQNLTQDNYKNTFPELLPYIEGAEHDFPGNMISLNGQIALALVKDVLNKDGWNLESFCNWSRLKGKKGIIKQAKEAMTDKQVEEFIKSSMKTNNKISKTACLRQLRDGGRSCEQKRFQKIYENINLVVK